MPRKTVEYRINGVVRGTFFALPFGVWLMKIKYNSEMIAGSSFAVIAAIGWFLIPSQIATYEKSSINAQTFPAIALSGLFIFSCALFLQGLFLRPKKEVSLHSGVIKSEAFKKEIRSVIFILLLLAYAFVIGKIGFLIATSALVAAILIFYGARKWYYYAIAIATVFIVYFVFSVMLHVSLPTGGLI